MSKKKIEKETKAAAARALYFEIRKIADSALRKKNYEQSRHDYLNGAKQIEHFADIDNRLCALYAGAGNAARWQGKYALSLRYFNLSISHLRANHDCFIDMLDYIIESLTNIFDWLKTEKLRQSIALMARKMLRQHSARLSKAAPQAKTKSYTISGSRILDRFSSLEENSEATKAWLKSQAMLTRLNLLTIITTFKKPKEFYDAAFAQVHRVPFKAGDFYFYTSVDQSGYTTVRRALASAKNQRGKIVYSDKRIANRNAWMSGFRVNLKGNLLAYGMSNNGSDFETWRVRDLDTGKDLDDIIEEVPSGSIRFHHQKAGLIYRHSQENLPTASKSIGGSEKAHSKDMQQEPSYSKRASIFFHRLGDHKKKDKVIHNPTADWVDIYGLQNKQHALISEWPAGKLHNRFLIKCLSNGKMCALFPRKIGYYTWLGENKGKLFIKTDHKAPRGRVLALTFDFKNFAVKTIEEIIPQSEFTLQEVSLLRDRILTSCLDSEGKTRLLQYRLDGTKLDEIALPFNGTLSSLSTEFKDKNIFFSLENFATARTIYRHNIDSEKTVVLYEPRYSMTKRVVQKMVQVESKDGVMVPMNIAYLKGTKLNGNNPTLLSVYGGFSIASMPYFSYQTATWLAMGGIWAQPYLRGGDELGADWHLSATKENKQLTYDDTIACAEWLVREHFSKPKKIAINGGSNGGLTVGAAITQRPDLFGAAIADNGLFDMLKYSFHGLGWAWQSEYGSVGNINEFDALRAYSPYHCVEKLKSNCNFPNLLINASAGDNRVVPWHSYKFAAACQQRGFPALLNVKWQEGHSWGRPDMSVRDNLAYLQWALKMK
ncbi:prolyl oligopeptidase family serine peptidase [soil metagenome]